MAAVLAETDVLVIGGGTAALCAAISARLAGAAVVLAEEAGRDRRGGNTCHSRNFRIAHDAPSPLFPDQYSRSEFAAEIAKTADGRQDPALTRLLVEQSQSLPGWLQEQGVIFQTTDSPTLPWSRRTAFFLGGGMAMLNILYRRAETLGIRVFYETGVSALPLKNGLAAERVETSRGDIRAKAVIACCGGYQANRDWLCREWGDTADGFINRGTPHAKGAVLASLLVQGAATAGLPGTCHLVAVDARSPEHDGGIVTRGDSISWGIVVDRNGRRFHDEGIDTGPTRYAVWGRKLLECPGHTAYSILDQAALRRAPPSMFPPLCQADSIAELAVMLKIDAARLEDSVRRFNAAITPGKDATKGLSPAKSQRAFPLLEPPFSAFPLRTGITFTCQGVKVDETARVVMSDGPAIANLFAAGMIMSPNILGGGYLAGAAMTIGAVFGRIAGREAARHALD